VTVPVSISSNPGIAGFRVRLTYDSAKLEPVGIVQADLCPGAVHEIITEGGSSYVQVFWYNTYNENITADGVLFSVNFKIAAEFTEGSAPLRLSYTPGDISNSEFKDVSPVCEDGSVTIKIIMYGDIYTDQKINTKDILKLSQYLAGWNVTMTEDERKAADVFYDQKINTKDILLLSQYLAGWNVKIGPVD
jgi:hypothetical protein